VPNVQLTASQIAPYAAQAGFAGSSLVTAIAVALAESSGNTWAINNDADGSQDQGLWQINSVHFSEFPGSVRDPGQGSIAAVGASRLFDPATNAIAAWVVSGGAANFAPWSTYTSGAYRAHLAEAQTAAGVYAANPTSPPQPAPGALGSGTASQAGFGYYLVDDYDVPIFTGPDDRLSSETVPSAVVGLVVAGLGDIGASVTAGSVELDADQVGQLTFTVQDPAGKLAPSLVFDTPVTYKGMRFRIASVESTAGGGGGLAWEITAMVAIAQQMKRLRNPPTAPSGTAASSGTDTLSDTAGSADQTVAAGTGSSYTDGTASSTTPSTVTDASGQPNLATSPVSQNPNPGTSITPTDYIASYCKQFGGVLFYGAPTYTQQVISPIPVTQGLPPDTYGETVFDVCSRLASNYGYWFFDADGTNVWFGPPGSGALTYEQGQGIVSRGTPFKVGWNGAWNGDTRFDSITFPDCRRTIADILTPATIVVDLPRGRGELVRPGMCMWLKGVPNFDADGAGSQYVVTKVTWNLDAGQTPVQVTAVTPINPVPTDQALLPQPAPVTSVGQGNQGTPYNQQLPLSSDPKATHLAQDFVTIALEQVGLPYVWGAVGPSSFDCSGLVEYCAARVGLTYPAPGVGGSRSQAQYETSLQAAAAVPVAVAAATRGALLFAGPNGSDHVAISLGDGVHTVEALNTQVGVVVDGSPGSADSIPLAQRFAYGALIPGLDYNNATVIVPGNPSVATPLPYGLTYGTGQGG
jgi:cell wall-associated NlpC family hydrolase